MSSGNRDSGKALGELQGLNLAEKSFDVCGYIQRENWD
jgi:hypothetical protein